MHHERQLSDEMSEVFAAARAAQVDNLERATAMAEPISRESSALSSAGPTGEFPDGKLTENDEGGLVMGLAVYKGKIVVNFGKPVASIGLDVENAKQLAKRIDLLASRIRRAEFDAAAAAKRSRKSKR